MTIPIPTLILHNMKILCSLLIAVMSNVRALLHRTSYIALVTNARVYIVSIFVRGLVSWTCESFNLINIYMYHVFRFSTLAFERMDMYIGS